jgi:diaminohydroxyphosphoribosylaminopyrimidine deaminase/5-amino-6-(5-phosphoribosylamino)uracil reductase
MAIMKIYEKYMKKCIKLAKKGEGKTSPNPLVGCVVLDKNGVEISNGYHKKYGEFHAEANALKKLKGSEADGGTLIVSLEPCSHQGKTPPCADLIIEKGIKTLVVGMQDPNPIVAGEGIEKCKKAGIKVIENVITDEVSKLNEVFIKNMTKKACFVALKAATTLDGKIATKTGSSKWITSEKARGEVQKIRNRYDSILTTSSTIIKDNPSMTCRLKNGKNPIKIVLDRELKTNFDSKIFETSGEEIYIVIDENIDEKKISAIPKHLEIIKCPVLNSKLDLVYLVEQLFERKIMSVLIEAGAKLNGEAISLGLVDKIYQFIAPKILADKAGLNAFEGRNVGEISEAIDFDIDKIEMFKPDILITLYKKA